LNVKIKLLTADAKPPTRATQGSAGYDLYAAVTEPVTIKPGDTVMINCGIAIAVSDTNVAAFVFPRSGLASKFGVALANCVGVIDNDYRGEIIVPLHNSSRNSYTVQPNERIAQMVFLDVVSANFIPTDVLDDTERGMGGFGSSQ
jgi:dUTP pyrophosphatase